MGTTSKDLEASASPATNPRKQALARTWFGFWVCLIDWFCLQGVDEWGWGGKIDGKEALTTRTGREEQSLHDVISTFLARNPHNWEELGEGTGARLAGKQRKEGSKHWRRKEDKGREAAVA